MGVSSTNNRMDYVGTGLLASYDYTFKIFEDTDLLVTVRDTAGVETVLTLNTDYSVSGVGEGTGGAVDLVDNSASYQTTGGALKSGYEITIRRVLPLTQETDIRNQGPYYPSIHEDQFDRFIMIDQQQQDEIDRSLKAPEGEEGADLVLPSVTDRASKFLAFDSSGDPIASSGSISDAIPVSAFIETLLDDANAAAARTTLDAAQTINNMTAETSPATGDLVSIYDLSATADRKMTLQNLMTVLAKDTNFPAGNKIAGTFSNLGLVNATTTNSNDSIKIQGSGATLSSTNPFLINMPSTVTAGLIATLSATADVTIPLTGAHWGLGTNGDFSGIALRVYAINDSGTLKFGVSNRGGYRSIPNTSCFTTATSVVSQFHMLVNSAISAGTWPCVEIGHFLASFDDTGGAAEDLWSVSSSVTSLNPGRQPQANTDWQSVSLTTGLTGGSHTVTAYEKIVGDTWFVRGRISFTSIFTGGSATLAFPSNRRLDVNKVHPMSTNYNRLGDATLIDTSNNSYVGCILYASTSAVQIQAVSDDGGNGAGFLTNTGFSTANPFTWTNDDIIDFYFSIPILGFSGN